MIDQSSDLIGSSSYSRIITEASRQQRSNSSSARGKETKISQRPIDKVVMSKSHTSVVESRNIYISSPTRNPYIKNVCGNNRAAGVKIYCRGFFSHGRMRRELRRISWRGCAVRVVRTLARSRLGRNQSRNPKRHRASDWQIPHGTRFIRAVGSRQSSRRNRPFRV